MSTMIEMKNEYMSDRELLRTLTQNISEREVELGMKSSDAWAFTAGYLESVMVNLLGRVSAKDRKIMVEYLAGLNETIKSQRSQGT